MTLQVWHYRLRSAAADWEDRGDDLHGASKTISAADTALLGSRVAGVAETFFTSWGDEIQTLRVRANLHSTDLNDTANEFGTSDADTVEAMQRLLSWEDRDTTPVQGGPGLR